MNDFKAKPSSRRIKTGDNTPINASPVGLEAGLFIEMDICGVKAKLLVDTGATVTLISTRLFHRIPEENQPKLSPFSRAILDAGGNCLPISGFGTFSAKICALSCKLDGVVADLSNEGIVGLDFMDENERNLFCQKVSSYLVLTINESKLYQCSLVESPPETYRTCIYSRISRKIYDEIAPKS